MSWVVKVGKFWAAEYSNGMMAANYRTRDNEILAENKKNIYLKNNAEVDLLVV